MPKKYEVKTLEDVINVVTAENIDNFLKDFGGWLNIQLAKKQLNKNLDGLLEIKSTGTLTWIDDNKNDVEINIKIQ